MATKATIRTRVLSNVANHSMITSANVNTILEAEHVSILEDYSWSRRKADTLITLVAPYSTGTVSSSGATVTGSGTTFTSAMVGRYFRSTSSSYFHRITGFTSTTEITLEASLPSDLAAGSTYTIFKHVYNLPSDFGREINVIGDNRLRQWARSDIERIDPYRSSTANHPDVYSIRGLDPDTSPSQIFQIEFWPVPAAVGAIRVEYLKANSLTNDTDEPMYRSDVLVWKASETAAYFLHARTGDQSWLALADRYHQRYTDELQEAKNDDMLKFSPVRHVRDAMTDPDRGDDWYLSHDPINLR